MFLMTYNFQVEWTDKNGFPQGKEVEIKYQADTPDIDHAYELAERAIENGIVILPVGANLKTLRIFSEEL